MCRRLCGYIIIVRNLVIRSDNIYGHIHALWKENAGLKEQLVAQEWEIASYKAQIKEDSFLQSSNQGDVGVELIETQRTGRGRVPAAERAASYILLDRVPMLHQVQERLLNWITGERAVLRADCFCWREESSVNSRLRLPERREPCRQQSPASRGERAVSTANFNGRRRRGCVEGPGLLCYLWQVCIVVRKS